MNATIKRTELIQLLANTFQEQADTLTESRTRDSIGAWDSMATLMLMADIDERLHVTFDEDELRKLTSVGDIFELLRSKQVAIEEG